MKPVISSVIVFVFSLKAVHSPAQAIMRAIQLAAVFVATLFASVGNAQVGGFAITRFDNTPSFDILDSAGIYQDTITPGSNILDLTYDQATGDLFLLRSLDSNSSAILKYEPDGALSTFANLDFETSTGADISISPLGGFAIARFDNTPSFDILDSAGIYQDTITPGSNILDLTYDQATGDLFLLRSLDSNSSAILKYEPDGALSTFANLDFETSTGADISISPLGGFAIARFDNTPSFDILDSAGIYQDTITPGSNILDLTYDQATGDLFLLRSLDSNSSAILKYEPDGALSTFANLDFETSTGADISISPLVQQVQVDATRDTGFIDLAPDNNLGANTHTPVGVSNNTSVRRSLLYFDVVGQVPSGATITNVVFEFDTQNQGGPQGQQGADYSLHRVTTAWDEGTGVGNIGEPTFDGASWNDAKAGVPWNTPGGDFDATSLGDVYVDAPDGALGFQIGSSGLNTVVQEMLDNPADNYGFMLRNVDEELLGSASRVISREGTGGTVAGTRLVIDYIVHGQQLRVDSTFDTAFMDLAPDNNFGAHTHTPVGVANNESKRRSLFYFDVAGQIPEGATITNVKFEFDTTQQGGLQGQQGADYSLHRVTTEWNEGTGTGNIGEPTFDGASWNDAKAGVPWNTPGGDFDSTSLGTVFVDAPDGALGFQITSADLTAAVQDMLDNPAGNYGFIMKNIDEGLLGSASRVVSREGTGGALAGTRLLINYIYSVPGVPVEVPATDFSLIRGVLVEGDLTDSFASDDMRMRFNPGFTLNSMEAPVWLIFDANLSTDSPNSLNLQIETQAGTPGLTATTEAWNWNTSTFDVVDISATSFNDDTVITPALTPGDHVQSGTAAVHSRLGWRKTGFTINYPWEVRLDQFVWVEE